MLTLSTDQAQALQALQQRRHLARLAQCLGDAFPEVPARLGDRYPRLIALGVQRAGGHGLHHLAAVARYLACWFALGAEFEGKPGHAWAQRLLASAAHSEGAKAFQLARYAQDLLQRQADERGAAPATAALQPAGFALALQQLDAALQSAGELGSLLPPQILALGTPCDLDALDLRPAPTPAPRELYTLEQGQWQRSPVPAVESHWTWTADAPAAPMPAAADAAPPDEPGASDQPGWPEQLHLFTAPARPGEAALHLRCRAQACCDLQRHPLLRHNSRLGLQEWRGPHLADIKLSLAAEHPPEQAAGGPLPVLAAAPGPTLSVLGVSACGLREHGRPWAERELRLAVYPSAQHWLSWTREAGPAFSSVAAVAGAGASVAHRHRAYLECDGQALDASAWQRGLADLDRQLGAGLARLSQAWLRDSGVEQGEVQAEPRVMCGSAGISWGWVDAPAGWAAAPTERVVGLLDLVACQLNLQLTGQLRRDGTHSRVVLRCTTALPLQQAFERPAGEPDLLAAVAPARCSGSLSFELAFTAMAGDDAALLEPMAPVAGSVVVEAGMRQRPQGHGLQWFVHIGLEPVSLQLQWRDPLLGTRQLHQPLLPALTLLDWSLG